MRTRRPRSLPAPEQAALRHTLDALHDRYTWRRFAHPDPVEFLYRYPDVRDREIAGLLAAGLAYGRVAYILLSVARVLDPLGARPAAFLAGATRAELEQRLVGFRHRWTTGAEVLELLLALQGLQRSGATVEDAFAAGLGAQDETVLPALTQGVRELGRHGLGADNSLVPRPERQAACKRLHLYLRWMVRADDVDPGGWTRIRPAQLLVPVDVHMHRIGRALGFTRRRQANLGTVLEITHGFRQLAPEDPVRYDFAVTRMPIRDRMTPTQIRLALRRSL